MGHLVGTDADMSRMRSATILILSLRSLAHETIKNLVLAGIGRLIIMDDGFVTEEDLGGGFLFREEEGAVGKPVCHGSASDLSLHPRSNANADFNTDNGVADRSRSPPDPISQPTRLSHCHTDIITFHPIYKWQWQCQFQWRCRWK